MRYVIILFDNGEWNHSDINAKCSDEEICRYYWQFVINPVRTLLIRNEATGEFRKYENKDLYKKA